MATKTEKKIFFKPHSELLQDINIYRAGFSELGKGENAEKNFKEMIDRLLKKTVCLDEKLCEFLTGPDIYEENVDLWSTRADKLKSFLDELKQFRNEEEFDLIDWHRVRYIMSWIQAITTEVESILFENGIDY
jgi:hypothetical protein